MESKSDKKRNLKIHKEVRRLKREEQLKSGAKLTTRTIPDKSKYKRKKNIDTDE
ncbi:MAG: hypothetical protein ACM3PX_10495 [Omnitrophica WOR_2 bacterium]|jgi:hypothetical protein